MSHRLLNDNFLPEKLGVVLVYAGRAPTVSDSRVPEGSVWLDKVGDAAYILVDKGSAPGSANWVAIGSITPPLAVDQGGTGQTSYTNGQLLIGNTTGNTLAKATLTQGAGMTITNGTGTITLKVNFDEPPAIGDVTPGTGNFITVTTSDAADGLTITSNSISADGTNADIDINLTPKGTGKVNIPLVDIDGGTIDSVTITASTVEATTYTTDDAADGLTITSNDITADGTNADIDIGLTPKGAGAVAITGAETVSSTLDVTGLSTLSGGAAISTDLSYDGIAAGYANSEQVFKQAGVQTTDATITAIDTITLAANTMVTVEARINGFIDDYSANLGARIFYTARRAGAGAVETSAPIVDILEDSAGAPSADIDVSGNDVRILVQGVAAETWNWTVSYNYHLTQTNA